MLAAISLPKEHIQDIVQAVALPKEEKEAEDVIQNPQKLSVVWCYGDKKVSVLQVYWSNPLPSGNGTQNLCSAKHVEPPDIQEPVESPQVEDMAESAIFLFNKSIKPPGGDRGSTGSMAP